MGAAYTKVLNYLYIVDSGEATTDSNIKKAKMNYMLSSTQKPTKPNPSWKTLELQKLNRELSISNLKAGAKFIHECRCKRENIAVIMEPNNRESAAFIVAYFSILTGLPAKFTRKAVMKCREKLDITSEYDSIIESMQNSATAKQLRDDLFHDTSGYTEDKLIEDLRRIYQLAELDAPTSSEIQLETRRDSMKLESSTTQNNSLNQLFRRLSTDTNKQDVTGSSSSSSSSNQRDYKTPDIIIQDDDENKKQDPVNSPSSTNPQHPHHDHSNSPFTTNQPDKIDNRVGNDTNQTQSIDNAHNTDLNSAHNKMHSSSNIDHQHQHHHHDSMQKSKFSKVTITYAPSRESVESDAVDEYLRSTSAEERDRVRKRVAITHAHVKPTDDDNDYL